MKIWKQKVLIPKLGVCEVRQFTDGESSKHSKQEWAPFSHGFVHLYQNEVRVICCGSAYAKERIIK